MADLRAALFSSQQSEKEYADNMKDYQEQVSELRIELQSAKQIIMQEGMEKELLKKAAEVRSTFMAQRESFANQNKSSTRLS